MPVSVIIPNFNNARFLARCIGSLEQDPHAVAEIVVVDNASTDGSVAVIEALADPRIRLIRNTTNVGAARARAIAVEAASHDWLSFLDGDDFLSPGAITSALEIARARDLDMAVLRMVRVDMDGENPQLFLEGPESPIDGVAAFVRTLGTWRIHPMGVFHRRVYEAASARFTAHGHSDDELFTRLQFLAARRVGASDGVYHYRVVPKPVTLAKSLGHLRTDLEVLRLATSGTAQGVPPEAVRSHRDILVGTLVKTWLKYHGRSATTLAEIADGVARSRVPWTMADWKHRLAFAALRPLLPRVNG